MNSPTPSDYSPLSFGAGLAVGLLLILALPAEQATKRTETARSHAAVGYAQ
jgi:hypothetical protein